MTVATRPYAYQAARTDKVSSRQRVGLAPRFLRFLVWAAFGLGFLLVPGALPNVAFAEALHVKAAADAGLPQVQARQQALDRALAEAVFAEARRMLGPVPEPRLEALRVHLAPQALDYVLTYQEVHAPKAQANVQADAQSGQAAPPATHAAATPLEFEADVEVNRTLLRSTLVGLGFFSETPAPLAFFLRIGPGVTESDAAALAPLNVLLGLARTKQNAPAGASSGTLPVPDIVLEHMPQGYYKAVLRQGQKALAVDSASLPALWLNLWGKHFTEAQRLAGPGMQRLNIVGFPGVDAALELLQAISTWEEAVQEPKLGLLELSGEQVSAQYVCRVINQKALDARLTEALAARKLDLASQTGQTTP